MIAAWLQNSNDGPAPLMFRAFCLAVALMLAAPAEAGEALDALRALIDQNYEALASDYAREDLGNPQRIAEAAAKALEERSAEDRHRMGTRYLSGRWREKATVVANRLCQRLGWTCRTVEISDHFAPRVAIFDNKLVISRATLALTRNDSELAAAILRTLWVYQEPGELGKIVLANRANGERARVYSRSALQAGLASTKDAAHLIRALAWASQIEGPQRLNDRLGDALARAGYDAGAARVVDMIYHQWDRLQQSRGVGQPDFVDRTEDEIEDVPRPPADQAYLAQLDGLPMGVWNAKPFLSGNRLLIPAWRMTLYLPREYDWRPYGDGVIATAPWQAEEVTIEPFEPDSEEIWRSRFFTDISRDLIPTGPVLTAENGMEFALAPGRTSQRRDQPEIVAYSARFHKRGAFHVTVSGVADEVAERRQTLMDELYDRIERFDDKAGKQLAIRTLRIVTLKTPEDAVNLLAMSPPEDERLIRVLNGLHAMERLPLDQPLKVVR